ncbi:hypothetical protein GL218_04932 [Daldinia childiae]|uniref:uncharacterized protein n=1 Tax=Daldinia childiae TaxID=326645 RepID=UPI00144662DE|nr:uncharacterized protein GL218_04932 [Daldinia childiae]KAF3059408.1 hypothetical protein GL218_04932 [Daldinia childiae]
MPLDSLIDEQDPATMSHSLDSTGSTATQSNEDTIDVQILAGRRIEEMRNLRAEYNPEAYTRASLPPYSERPIASHPQSHSAPSLSSSHENSPPPLSLNSRGPPSVPLHDMRRCGNCDRIGHDLSICVGPPGLDGALHGCPCCNTTAHTFDDCPRASLMSDNLKYYYLVLLRGRRAPISTRQDYLGMAASRERSEFYPWTRAYARNVPPSTFDSHDYSRNDPRALPTDPAMASKAALLETRRRILEIPVTAHQLEYLNSLY